MQKHIEIIHDGLTMRGYHHQVKSDELVVMFHGFTGNKTESRWMFKKLSNEFEKLGLDSIRMDYLGSAESDGEFRDMTYKGLTAQAKTVLQYATEYGYNKINVLGFSMGGIVSIGVLNPEINKAILIAPSTKFYPNIKELFENSTVLENGNIDHNGFELGQDFLTSIKGHDFFEIASKYHNPTLIINGKMDRAVDYRNSVQLHESMINSELLLIDDCDHLFSSLKFYEILKDRIIEFLQK